MIRGRLRRDGEGEKPSHDADEHEIDPRDKTEISLSRSAARSRPHVLLLVGIALYLAAVVALLALTQVILPARAGIVAAVASPLVWVTAGAPSG